MIRAAIPVDDAKEHVFAVLTGYADYVRWLPNCESSKVMAGDIPNADAEIVINSMKRMTLGLRFEAVGTQVLNFKMYSGTDMKAYSGSYRLMDGVDGKGTVVVAELEIDAGAMAPKFLVDRMAKKAIEETGVALRKYLPNVAPPASAPGAAPAAPRKAAAAVKRAARSRRILQVVRTSDGETRGALLTLLDLTRTAFGARLLRRRLTAPLALLNDRARSGVN